AASVSASAIVVPNAFVRWKTIVVSFGVLIPEIGLSVVADDGAPTIGKYPDAYPFCVFVLNIREKAHATSLEVSARLTGGLNFQPDLMCTVTVLPSALICGAPEASSGVGLSLVGVNVYSGVCVAYTTR